VHPTKIQLTKGKETIALHPEVRYWKKNGKYSKRPCHPPIVLVSFFGRIIWYPLGLDCEFLFLVFKRHTVD
jgi:hypothetical protein